MLKFFLGAIFGTVVMAVMSVSGDCSKIEEAYYKGFEDGKAAGSD